MDIYTVIAIVAVVIIVMLVCVLSKKNTAITTLTAERDVKHGRLHHIAHAEPRLFQYGLHVGQ